MLKRIIYSIHRVLGTFLSILFLVWFLSGFVMIYHNFPRVTPQDRHRTTGVLSADMPEIGEVLNRIYPDTLIQKINLKTTSYGQSVFEISTKDSSYNLVADSSEFIRKVSYAQIENYAQKWCSADIVKVDTLSEVDQWIPFNRLAKDMPIYKFHFGDSEKHQLYISSRTGEALQFTDKNSRFWAWVGAIPHWVYFTSLRQDGELWNTTVIWLSGLGSVMCLLGFGLGIYILVKQYGKKKKTGTPYRKFSYKWHHILGFVFGVFVFTFVFSGMMSLASIPDWVIKEGKPSGRRGMFGSSSTLKPQAYQLDYRAILLYYPHEVKGIEWTGFDKTPIYKVVTTDSTYVLDASANNITPLLLTEQVVKDKYTSQHKEPITVSVMTEYDNYYVDRKNKLPLPVYKIDIDDADKTTYYVNPQTGDVRSFTTKSRMHKWMYQGLHSFNFKFLAEHPILWNMVMWVIMIGGTLVSLSGVLLSYKYLRRKFKRLTRKNCKKE
ncbi:PepSY domain-containing protein [Dysgonomonas sp. HDW5B]|uniref:PepSY domain-containing protein n=1 Tax=Dysgonomonas sp. HDW5B TaxID=2714927 RepID=UPI00140D7C5C|nr:PepSY domain-containing protein [Dysgonomonas sp. HDW5B]QIK54949.1 PepSY domain-containing protein [Dysgonomonas sp. HDW5B]